MTQINIQTIKEFGTYLGLFEGIGYLYQVEGKMFKINSNGVTKL